MVKGSKSTLMDVSVENVRMRFWQKKWGMKLPHDIQHNHQAVTVGHLLARMPDKSNHNKIWLLMHFILMKWLTKKILTVTVVDRPTITQWTALETVSKS